MIQFVTSKTRRVGWLADVIIVRGKAPAGGFKFEVQVNGVIYGPPDVVSFSREHALQNILTSSFLPTQGTEEKKKAKAECAKYALRSLGQP